MFRLLAGLLLTTSLAVPAGAALATPDPVADAATRIMAMGSSTTAGSVPGGYRTDLYQLLTAEGRSVDFVGSQTGPTPPQLPDREHEGYGGYRLNDLIGIATDRMRTYQPDVVLLHAGANDVIFDDALAAAPARLERLVRLLLVEKPSAAVYVSTVGPFTDAATAARGAAYNRALPFVVAKLAREGFHARLVEQPLLQASDVQADKIHLTHSGNSRMAAAWYAALAGSPLLRTEAETARYAGKARTATTVSASGNAKAAFLDDTISSAEVTVLAPVADRYRIFVRGGNGSAGGAVCTHTLTVNGGAPIVLEYPNFGWENWTERAVDVDLPAGDNRLRFTGRTCYAEVDAVDLVLPATTWPA